MSSPGGMAPPAGRGYVPLVSLRRGDTVESVHFGAIAVVDSSRRAIASAGDPGTVIFLRSAAKPFQVLPLLESGAAERFGISEEEIAVMSGSHGGEPFHVDAVLSILAKIGLDESALLCGAHAPSHRPSAQELRRLNRAPGSVHNNCSGKHAGMLALAVRLGAPTATYLEETHPVQVRIRAAVERFAGLEAGGARPAIDGCSAPTFAMPIRNAALMYSRLLDPEGEPPGFAAAARRVVAAMRRYPQMIAGTDRLCTALMEEPGDRLIAKIGAEGVYGLAYDRGGRGIGIALKIADGEGQRARPSAALDCLRQLGVLTPGRAAALRARFVGDLTNHRGLIVGGVETVFGLETLPEDPPSPLQ